MGIIQRLQLRLRLSLTARAEFFICYNSLVNKVFFFGLIFIPITVVAHYAGVSPIAVFFLSAISIIPLAKYIGESTEELSGKTGPAVGGLLNATFGNAPELLIGLFALQAGLFEVVKASITGSIVSNLLLVLGVAMMCGGWGREKQEFNRTAVLAAGSALFVGVIALVIPAVFVQSDPTISSALLEQLSIAVSIALLITYAATIFFSLHTHKHLYISEIGKFESKWSVGKSIFVLLAATVAVAWMSEILVGAIEPVVEMWGWSQLFIGVVVIAIIGNAAEHFSAVTVAIKDRMDLSLNIAIGSATQIVMFVAPVLVLISFLMGTPMNLLFDIFELMSIVLSILAVNLIVADGESNWLEGVQLFAAYVIMALAFFFHP